MNTKIQSTVTVKRGNPNWLPGQSGNPGGLTKIAREAKRLSQGFALEALERLAYWMRSDDHKASIPACLAILDRGLGKPKEIDQEEESEAIGLSDAELLHEAIARAKAIEAGN